MVMYGIRAKYCVTNRGNKKKSTKNQNQGNGRMVRVQGPSGFRLDLPIPRLPRWLGTPNISQNNAVYPRVNLDIPIIISTQPVTAGAIALASPIDTTNIPSWATRFASLFKEFAIVGARFELRVTSVTNPQGLVLAYIDEDSAAAPGSSSLNYAHAEVPLVASAVDSTGSLHRVEWVARSYQDLTWDSVGTTGNVGYLKIYANSGFTGTSSTTAAQILVSGVISVCFRGYI